MSDLRHDVLADLRIETELLDGMVDDLDDEHWRLGTPAAGWDVATQVAHLAWTDAAALAAATDPGRWDELARQAMADPLHFADREAHAWAATPRPDLLRRWREGRAALEQALRDRPSGDKIPWYGPPMSPTSMATARFMETWAHGRDVADALGALTGPTDRIRHVVHLGVRTRDFGFAVHDVPPPADEFRMELVAPSGETWSYGPEDAEQSVTGSAFDFALLVTQRRHLSDLDLVARGEDAERWLSIAQAFAGPPGSGREPGAQEAPR